MKKDELYLNFQDWQEYYLGNINGKPFGLAIGTDIDAEFDNGEGEESTLTEDEQKKILVALKKYRRNTNTR